MNIYERAKFFDEMAQTMKNLEVSVRRKEMDLASCLFFTGDEKLIRNSLALVTLYPSLGFRPIKAAAYVHHREMSKTKTGWTKRQTVEGDGHEITRKENGVFLCSCMDFCYNLKAIEVAQGPPQQPCCHILATALSHPEILAVFIQ